MMKNGWWLMAAAIFFVIFVKYCSTGGVRNSVAEGLATLLVEGEL
jgi:hypothetical protein